MAISEPNQGSLRRGRRCEPFVSKGWLDRSDVGKVSVVVQNGSIKSNRNGGYEQVIDLPTLETSGCECGLQSARDAKVVRVDIDNRETCEGNV